MKALLSDFYFKPQLPEPFSSPNELQNKTHSHWKNVQKVFWKMEKEKKVYSDLFLLRVPFFDGKFDWTFEGEMTKYHVCVCMKNIAYR